MKIRNLTVCFLMAGLIAPAVAQNAGRDAGRAQDGVAVYMSRARTQDAQGRHDLAAENWREVLLLSPRNAEALRALAEYSRQQGDEAKANAYLNRLKAVAPQSAPSAPGLSASDSQKILTHAAALAQQHQYAEAVALFRRVLGDNPTSGDWAVVYYQTEAAIPADVDQAVEGLRKIVAEYPANPGYQLALARVLTYSPATRAEGLQRLADFHGSPSAMEQARIAWRDALLWDPKTPGAQSSGAIYLKRYPDEEVAKALRNGLEERERTASLGSPEEAKAYQALRNGNPEAAKREFTALLNQPGQAVRGHMGLGYVAMKQQDFPTAVQEFSEAKSAGGHGAQLESAWKQARYWDLMQRGTQAMDAGNNQAATDAFTQAADLQPNHTEAREALAGEWLKQQMPDRAMTALASLLQSHPDSANGWKELAEAELQAGQYEQLLAGQHRMPPSVLDRLNRDPDYVAAVASAQMSLGQDENARSTIAELDALPSADDATRCESRVRLAGLLIREGRTEEAVRVSMQAVREDRGNPNGWSTLIRAEHEAGHDGSAVQLVRHLPPAIRQKLMQDPGFLMEAAASYQKEHDFEQAAEMLVAARQVGSAELQTSVPLQLRVASLDQEMGKVRDATAIYRQVIREAPGREEAWIGFLSALHVGGQDAQALEVARQIPLDVRTQLRSNTGFLQVLASIYSGVGDQRRAMQYLRLVTAHYREQGVSAPFAVDAQYAWLQLNAGDEAGLSQSLAELSKQQDLSFAQKKEVENIWVARSIRRAEAALQIGNGQQGMRILEVARQVYPGNSDLRREVATFYIREGQPEKAYAMYDRFDWSGAVVADFAGGVSAAAATRHEKQGEAWLKLGLIEYPGNRRLLTEGARMEQTLGNFARAEGYWRELRAQESPANTPTLASPGTAAPMVPGNAAAELAQMLTPAQGSRTANTTSQLTTDPLLAQDTASVDRLLADLSGDAETGRSAVQADAGSGNQSGIQPASQYGDPQAAQPGRLRFGVDPSDPAPVVSPIAQRQDRLVLVPASDRHFLHEAADSGAAADPDDDTLPSNGPDAGSSSSLLPSPGEVASMTPDAAPAGQAFLGRASGGASAAFRSALVEQPQQPEDGLAELQARLSPYVGMGATMYSRSGQPGFDQLSRYEFNMEGSTVLGEGARMTILTQPQFLDAGPQGSNPMYAFGSGSSSSTTTANAARAILRPVTEPTSTSTTSAGQTVSGIGAQVQFATRFLQASLGYTPTTFPVHNTIGSLVISPSSSFSLHFSRQPVAETMLSYAGETDPATGEVWGGVVSTGGGIQVAHGTAESGFYGGFDYAELTGRNVLKNTSVHGSMGGYWRVYQNEYGYLTAGVNMTGMHFERNLQYFTLEQGGYFSPDAYMLLNAPLTWQSKPMKNFVYRIAASLGTQTYQQGSVMAGSFLTTVNTQAGASGNYSLDARGSYRITPNWYLEAWLAANNAYDYQQRLAGFSLRYMEHPHPASAAAGPTGLIDPQQIRPLWMP